MIDLDRRRGILIGLAVGDAMGASVEFAPPGTFPEVTDFRAGGPHGLEAGEWTDDTSMALALADSIAEAGWDLSACAYFAVVLAGLLHGLPREEVLDPAWPVLRRARELHALHSEIAEVAEGSFRTKAPPEIRGAGYVVRSLEAALWAFHNASDFREAVLRAVNLGDDADTTGAVCGQLAGAHWGERGIPPDWRQRLAGRELIERALDGLSK